MRKLSADPLGKLRVELIHQTMYGTLPVAKACERLGISRSYFDLLRSQANRGAVDAVTPKPSGRRRAVPAVLIEELQAQQDRIAQLEHENALLRAQVDLAGVRALEARRTKRHKAAKSKTKKRKRPSASRACDGC